MQLPGVGTNRRGATTVELAVVLLSLLTICLGMLDLGIGVFRYHIVSQAARQGARLAIVHGTLAPPQLAQWGPGTYSGKGDSSDPIPLAIAPYLAGLDPSQVDITVEWLDGDTDPDSRVRVTASTTYTPALTFIFGSTTYAPKAISTMRIHH